MRYFICPLLAPPSIPPLRGEEKDKLLILEGVGGGGGVLVPHNIGKCCMEKTCPPKPDRATGRDGRGAGARSRFL